MIPPNPCSEVDVKTITQNKLDCYVRSLGFYKLENTAGCCENTGWRPMLRWFSGRSSDLGSYRLAPEVGRDGVNVAQASSLCSVGTAERWF
jgi:hypothetical protein